MKKVLAVVAVVCVVFAAGAALAQPRARDDGRRVPPQMTKEFNGEKGHIDQRKAPQFAGESFDRGMARGRMNPAMFDRNEHGRNPAMFDRNEPGRNGDMPCRFGGRKGGRMMFTPDMPDEIRAKVVEAAKLHIDLDAVLSAKQIDKAKALEVFGKIQQAENEIETWKFSKRLEMMEAFRTQQELNRKNFNAPKPEAPAPAPAPEGNAQ